jgi:hypothetical protein
VTATSTRAAERDTPSPGRRQTVLTWATLLLAVPTPFAIVASFAHQVATIGEVSHWPWEEYGFFGWWLVPLAYWVAGACSLARHGFRSVTTGSKVILFMAAATTLALLYNP